MTLGCPYLADEDSDIAFISHGETTGLPEIYQISAWGRYQDELRLRGYGGIIVTEEGFQNELPSPFSEPAI